MRKAESRMSLKSFVVSWVVLSLVSMALVPVSAHAQENSEDPGFYLGAAFAIGIEQFDLSENFSSHDEGFGIDFWAGYRLTRYFALEGEFVYVGGFKASSAGDSVSFNIAAFTANVKFYPLTGSYRPYLDVGVGGGRFENESGPLNGHEKGGVFRFGGGVEMNFGAPIDFVVGADYLTTSGLGGGDFVEIKLGFQRKF